MSDLAGIGAFFGGKCGIEVPIAIGKLCAYNFSSSLPGGVSISQVISTEVPPAKIWIVTTRQNLYSVISMAVLELRWNDDMGIHEVRRARRVARSHNFARNWSPYELPKIGKIWPCGLEDSEFGEDLAPVAEMATSALPLEQKVHLAINWLRTGELPEFYVGIARHKRQRLVCALEREDIVARSSLHSRRVTIVVVQKGSSPLVGFSKSEIVVTSYKSTGAFEVTQFRPSYIKMRELHACLREVEPQWRGDNLRLYSGPNSQLALEDLELIVSQFVC